MVGNVNIYGATLTIAEDVTIDLQAYNIYVNSYSSNTNSRPASLYADNVTFTSSSSLYSQIIFDGSYYNITEYPAGGVLSNCTFENINFQFREYSHPVISNSTVDYVNDSGTAFSVSGGGTPTISGNIISGYEYPFSITTNGFPL